MTPIETIDKWLEETERATPDWKQELFTKDGSNDPMPNIYSGKAHIAGFSYRGNDQHIVDTAFAANARTRLPAALKALKVAIEGIKKAQEALFDVNLAKPGGPVDLAEEALSHAEHEIIHELCGEGK